MNIVFNPTRTITTADLFIACDPPMTFEVKAQLSTDWVRSHIAWEESGTEDMKTAIDLVSSSFLSVAQDGNKYPLDTIDAVQDLINAIEDNNKGQGNLFVCDILTKFTHNHYSFLTRSSANSAR